MSDTNPLVTVIMQNYNTPQDILDTAIYSVLNQSFNSFAFIFIDDWSTAYDASSFLLLLRQDGKN